MKITLQDALMAKTSCEQLIEKKFPAKTSFKLLQLKKQLDILEENFLKIKEKTLEKYGEKDKEGNLVIKNTDNGQSYIPVPEENQINFTEEILETLKENVEVTEFVFEIGDFGEELITPETLLGLFPFINK